MRLGQGCLLSILLYIIATEVITNFINTGKIIKRTQTGDREIKIANLADDTTIFLRDNPCLSRIQVILKLYENANIN